MAIPQAHVHDHVAARGESIFSVIVTRGHPEHGYLFESPRHLGEKKQAIDFYVELFSTSAITPYFLVQVKSTRLGLIARRERLRVGISAGHMQRLASYPAPTYVVGIDETTERGYIVSANGESTAGFSSMCTDHPLTADVLVALHREVEAYWIAGPAAFTSAFLDRNWVQQ